MTKAKTKAPPPGDEAAESAAEEDSRTFEEDLEELESITGRLEDSDIPLEEAIAQFEKGTGLAVKLKKTLERAEAKILELTQDERLEDFLPPTDEN